MNLKELGQKANEIARAHGFYDPPPHITERLCLIHSEVTEALEAWRDDDMGYHEDANGKPLGFQSELADIIIRVVDLAHARGIDLDAVVSAKMKYNESRPFKHGRVR